MLNVQVAAYFLLAAVLGLSGTNSQARSAKARLFEDEDPHIAAAATHWRPLRFPWMRTTKKRRAAEALFLDDLPTWRRYVRMKQELASWNNLESSVALAFAGSCIVLVQAIRGA